MNLLNFQRNKSYTKGDFFARTILSGTRPVKVREEDVLKIPTVYAAIELITSSIAQLPLYLYQEQTDRSIEQLRDDRTNSLNHDANALETGQALKKKVVQDYLLRGKAYLFKKNGQLHYLAAKSMAEESYTDDNITVSAKKYLYSGLSRNVEIPSEQLIVIDSGTDGLLVNADKLFNTALSQLKYEENLLSNGALPTGVLKANTRLTEQAINRLKKGFDSLYSGTENTGKTLILEDGLDFSTIALSPDELSLHQSKSTVTSEIARVFNIPESMLNSSANKYASLEHNNLQFLQNCIGPIITAIESALDKSYLESGEKLLGFFFRFDTSELLRTTEAEKIKTISQALEKGLISFNEARHRLDLKGIEEDYFVLRLGQVLKKVSDDSMLVLNIGEHIETKEKHNGEHSGITI
ncbi:phage portal protein [Exiguobacterium alkaliphilum]|uniref:Phage portal protein n=1 Tax=Exiguobacterium alkaliphilum TaxID=1428684 RepID=A0ABT2L2B2_9BACL|nr:phage portal protein [Exiguobacterium alkaliphilum]MCT4796150.1 phage portal protein [Exiguobacterium alkaliphilum]